jgi:lipoate synthase
VEVLPADFEGGQEDISTVIAAEADVFAQRVSTYASMEAYVAKVLSLNPPW